MELENKSLEELLTCKKCINCGVFIEEGEGISLHLNVNYFHGHDDFACSYYCMKKYDKFEW